MEWVDHLFPLFVGGRSRRPSGGGENDYDDALRIASHKSGTAERTKRWHHLFVSMKMMKKNEQGNKERPTRVFEIA